MLIMVAALAGCQWLPGFGNDDPPAPAPIEVSALPDATPYPQLSTVPPRPQLSYSVEQRREIVRGLISDRAHARYTKQLVRYRTGRSSMPPPPAPTLAEAEALPPGLTPEPAPETRALPQPDVAPDDDDLGDTDVNDGGLDDFMRDMVRETQPSATPTAPEPESPDDAPSGDGELDASEVETPAEQPTNGDASRVAPEPVVVRAAAESTPAAARPTTKPAVHTAAPPSEPRPARDATRTSVAASRSSPDDRTRVIDFAAGSAELPADSEGALQAVVVAVKDRGGVIRVMGQGESMALALDRAHAVALGLLRHGVAADHLAIDAEAVPGARRVELIVDEAGGR